MSGSKTIRNSETRAETLQYQSSAFGVTVPVVHGTTAISGNLLWYGDFKAIAHTTTERYGKGGGTRMESTTYTYTASVIMGLCEGPISTVSTIWRGKETWTGGTGPAALSLTLFHGNLGQSVWSPLTSINGGAEAIGYSGYATFNGLDYELGADASVPNHRFEVQGFRVGTGLPGGTLDADPALIAQDWITDARWGAAIPSGMLGSTMLTEYSKACRAQGLLLSTALTEQAPAQDRLRELCAITNATIVEADEQIHIVPLGDETATGNGVTYTPDLTPIFDLTPDHFLAAKGERAVRISRKNPADAYNTVSVEYRDRSNAYSVSTVTVKDQASVDLYGSRPAPTIKAHWVAVGSVASKIARLKLNEYLYTLNTYEFSLPITFVELLPSNLVTLTVPSEQLDRVPVRITRVRDDGKRLQFEARDFPALVATSPAVPLQAASSFVHNYNVDPGNTTLHAVFEAPYERAAGDAGLEIWMAVKGGASWGGCRVWVSLDGSDYKAVGIVRGPTRCGAVTGAVSSGTLAVDGISGTLVAVSNEDARQLVSLCYVGGSNPEWLAYETATLTGTGAYTLGGLVRGAYRSGAGTHADNDVFVVCDAGLAKSGALDAGLIGKTVHIKLTSFNIYGHAEQDLSAVSATTYTVTGRWAKPSLNPNNLIGIGSFDAYVTGDRPPTWDGGSVVAVSGQPFAKGMRFGVTQQRIVEVDHPIPVVPGESLHISAQYVGTAAGDKAAIGVAFRNAAGTLSYVVAQDEYASSPAGTWLTLGGVVEAPAGAVAAYAYVERTDAANPATSNITVAEIILRRQSRTVDIKPAAATEVYNVEALDVTVTAVEMNNGVPGQEVTRIDLPAQAVACELVITTAATGTLTNGTATGSINFGDAAYILARLELSGVSTSYIGTTWSNPPGASLLARFSRASVGRLPIQAGLAYSVVVRAKKTHSTATLVLASTQLRVEVVKL